MQIFWVILYLTTLVLAGLIIWGASVVPIEEILESKPDGQTYQLTYYDRAKPGVAKRSETVSNIALNFGPERVFNKIPPGRLAASWVGRMSFDEPKVKQISVKQSWGTAKILVNGKEILNGGGNTQIKHTFSKGVNEIEVFYINNWHTVTFKVVIEDVIDYYSISDLLSHSKKNLNIDDKIIYVGLYEAANGTSDVTVDVGEVSQGNILWLDSYDPIDWRIVDAGKVKSVVVASHAPGSRVLGLDKNTPISFTKKPIGVHSKSELKCHCVAGTFHCYGGENLEKLESEVTKRTGLELVAYGTSYAARKIEPVPFNDDMREQIQQIEPTKKRLRAQCLKKSNPDFDTLFNSQ
ncbi:hypothetical protein [Roseibium sp.]|uniref:hypothetical protein n=1 Tax=Roseibium sp. TaxID=1936156 RepID=UPI003B52792E